MKLSKQFKRELQDKGALTLVAEVTTLIVGCVAVLILLAFIGA